MTTTGTILLAFCLRLRIGRKLYYSFRYVFENCSAVADENEVLQACVCMKMSWEFDIKERSHRTQLWFIWPAFAKRILFWFQLSPSWIVYQWTYQAIVSPVSGALIGVQLLHCILPPPKEGDNVFAWCLSLSRDDSKYSEMILMKNLWNSTTLVLLTRW